MQKLITTVLLCLLAFGCNNSSSSGSMASSSQFGPGGPLAVNVPGDYPTIQQAIDAIPAMGIVHVAPGTYYENINYHGKPIQIISTHGPRVTIIDGSQSGSVVTFNSNENNIARLEGFTIQNGCAKYGGGVHISNSSKTHNTSPTVIGNVITNNVAEDPNAEGYGGGISCGGTSRIENNLIKNNYARRFGGGVCIGGFDGSFKNNIISNNEAGSIGGGMMVSWQSPSMIFTNTLITNNTAPKGGGVMCTFESNPTFKNCTITGNKGGVNIERDSKTEIIDSIIANNNAYGYGVEISIFNDLMYHNASLKIDYSCVKGGKNAISYNKNSLDWGSNMKGADPEFAIGPKGFHYLSQISAGQSVDSPCVNSGSDLSGNLGLDTLWTRTDGIVDTGKVDMGFHYGNFIFPSLQANTGWIPENTGGVANFILLRDTANAHKNYLIFGSVSGISPGTPFPGGNVTLPINWDNFTNIVITYANQAYFQNFMGMLDFSGRSEALLNLPPIPGFKWLTLNFAYGLVDSLGTWDFASNPVTIEIAP